MDSSPEKDGGLDWLMEMPNPDKSDFGFNDFIDGVDGLIMGRNTFEMVVSFGKWPYAKPVFVLSNSLKAIPAGYEDKAEIVSGALKQILADLSVKGINKLYIDGGKTIQSFLKEDLIDELTITKIPVLLGSGIPLFVDNDIEVKLEHVKTEVLNNHMVKSHYIRKK